MAKKASNKTKVANEVAPETKLATSEELGVAANAPIESTDDEMEEPQTKNYNEQVQPAQSSAQVVVYLNQNLHDALLQTIGSLSYDYTMGTPSMSIKVHKFFDILNGLMGKPLTEKQGNDLINLIALAPYNTIHTVMDNIKNNQQLYFNVQQA